MIFTNVDIDRDKQRRAQTYTVSLVGFKNDFVVVGKISNSSLCRASKFWTSKMEKLLKPETSQAGTKKAANYTAATRL